jgi:hypothetical protein
LRDPAAGTRLSCTLTCTSPEEPTVIRGATPAGKPDPAVPISEARRRLFELVEEVLTGRADRVALSHRGYDEQVLLVRARDLAKLEADLNALRERLGPEPRPLRGLGTLLVDPDQVLVRTRQRQAALAAEKRAALHAEPARTADGGRTGGRGRAPRGS